MSAAHLLAALHGLPVLYERGVPEPAFVGCRNGGLAMVVRRDLEPENEVCAVALALAEHPDLFAVGRA